MNASARSISPASRSYRWPDGLPRDEVLVPGVHLVQVRVAAGGEGPAQVQGDGRAVVGADQPARVRGAGGGGEVEPVDGVAAVGGQLGCRPAPRAAATCGLANWPAILPIFTIGTLRAVGQHHRHLQQGLQLAAHRVGGGAGERLGAVAALQHERLAAGDGRQALGERVAFAGEDQRRQRGQLGGHRVGPGLVRPAGLLRHGRDVGRGRSLRHGPASSSVVIAGRARRSCSR